MKQTSGITKMLYHYCKKITLALILVSQDESQILEIWNERSAACNDTVHAKLETGWWKIFRKQEQERKPRLLASLSSGIWINSPKSRHQTPLTKGTECVKKKHFEWFLADFSTYVLMGKHIFEILILQNLEPALQGLICSCHSTCEVLDCRG